MQKATIKITLSDKLYLRDPQETELGQKILQYSISIIDEIGFEHFTFKKLAHTIESTEASVYRYFENKNKLLIYLVSWYWVWLDYKIQFHINNIQTPKEKLSIIIRTICETHSKELQCSYEEKALYRIVIAESAKAYLIKDVDEINQEGIYLNYKKLNKKIASFILEINPKYEFPNSLVSTIIEAAHQQLYFAQHLPSLTNIERYESRNEKIQSFLEHLLWSSIEPKNR